MAEATLPAQLGRALTERSQAAFQVWGRLRPGVSQSAAAAAMDALGQVIARQYAAPGDTTRVAVRPLSEELYAGPGQSGYVLGSAVLMAIVGLVLAIACANVANLQLARGVARNGEIAVRLAMGANRGRLIRQMLTESLLLSLVGCLLGGALGFAGCRFIWSFVPPEVAQNMIAPKLDSTVLVFTLCASVVTALVFGIAPALRAAGIDVSVGLMQGGLRQAGRSGGRTRAARFLTRALLAGQVAFSLICLATAALVLRNVQRAYAAIPGFDTHHLALFMMNPEQTGYDTPRLKAFYRNMRERLSAEAGIAAASWAGNLPFWNQPSQSVKISGTDMQKKEQFIPAVTATVDLNYFSVLGIPLVRGRVFGPEDREGARPVAVINAQLARERWPGGDALGQQLELTGEQRPRQVVGIVQTANYTSLGEAPQPAVYVPLDQKFAGGMVLYVRAKGDGASVMDVVQREIRNYDAGIAVTDVRSGDKLIDQALFGPKIGVRLLGAFGLLALALASAGLYGVMVYSVSQRRQEMGVRLAMGASPSKIIANVLREGFVPVSWGLALGSVCCVLLGRALSHLFGIGSFDFVSLAAGIACMLSVAFVACYLPARSAARVDPTCALRQV
jgi:macrolide transport system ATP-binding/permease protein